MIKRILTLSFNWISQYMISTFQICGLGIDVSRRLANEPYVAWVIVYNAMQILAYCTIESFIFPSVHQSTEKFRENKNIEKATSRLLHAYNRNGLFVFLLANILTGLVNLGFDTIHMDDYRAVGILGAYAFILSAVAVLLDRYNLSIKL